LNACDELAIDASGNLYISDSNNYVVRKVDTGGIITTYAGNGVDGYSGDGGPATSAEMSSPAGIASDAKGNLYIADTYNNVLRKVGSSGPPVADAPTFSPAPGTYTSAQTVTIVTNIGVGATIHYTIDGSTPTTSSSIYTAPLTVAATETIQTIAVAAGYDQSAVSSATYTITSSKTAQAITFNGPPSLTYGQTPQALAATASSGLPITYYITFSVSSLIADNYTFGYSPGTLTVTGKATQTITFVGLPDLTYSMTYGQNVTVQATATSGLAVLYQLIPVDGQAYLDYNILYPESVGDFQIVARQEGNSVYAPADPVTLRIDVGPALLTVKANDVTVAYGKPFTLDQLNYSITGFVRNDGYSQVTGRAQLTTTAALYPYFPWGAPIRL